MTGIEKKYICSPAGILGGCQQFSRRGSRIPVRHTKHLGGISELCGIGRRWNGSLLFGGMGVEHMVTATRRAEGSFERRDLISQ